MKLYRFSPIHDAATCMEALEYIDVKLRKLSGMVISEKLPVNTLKIFAHYDEEYAFIKRWVDSLGKPWDSSSPTSYYVEPTTPTVVNDDPIEYIGLRIPDLTGGRLGVVILLWMTSSVLRQNTWGNHHTFAKCHTRSTKC